MRWLGLTTKDVGIPKVEANATAMADILNTVYYVAGAVAVLVIVIAGFMMVVSSGNPERVKTARSAILSAVIGLVVVLMAAAITRFVIGNAS